MVYQHTCFATFIDRPNRFIAHVQLNDTVETVHVKNTGRCRELLVPGAQVVLQAADQPERKTKYDLIAVFKPELGWVNIDSQILNHVVLEWLQTQNYDLIRPEYTYGSSRIDFYMEKGGQKYLLEVKGCTLEIDHIGYFPDAPSERAAKHCRELAEAASQGYHCSIAFVIAMPNVFEVRPNIERDPEFALALREAELQGVSVLFLPCTVESDRIQIDCNQV